MFMSRMVWITSGVAALLFSGVIFSWTPPQKSLVPPVVSTRPSIESIRELSQLVSLQVQVADIVSVETEKGWFSGYKGAWIVKGDALWTTDLGKAIIDPSGDVNQNLRIFIPEPKITWSRVDHEQTRIYDLRRHATFPVWGVPEKLPDEVMRKAQELVRETAAKSDQRDRAKRQTEFVLTNFCKTMGYTTEIVWVKDGNGIEIALR